MGSISESLGPEILGSIGGKESGSIAVGTAFAGVLGGIAGAIGLVVAIDGAMKAFAPQ
ncbi:MAG: hypothetical protein L0H59_10580 [Tomitella sp.]|nr:hypothetical protein [Tomitella sp.]